VQLGLENKKKTMWAAVLGAVAILYGAYEFIPMFMGSSSTPATTAQAAAPAPTRVTAHQGGKPGKKNRLETLDPTLRLDLLAASEQTQYEGNGRNIFVSQAEEVVIPKPGAPGNTDNPKNQQIATGPSVPPPIPPAPPIPLKYFGFASKPGEAKKVFLSQGDDVFVAGEGEIVDRRYKVVRISPASVEVQDMVYSGPPQNIPLTQG
jgi:hypothetical protein